MVPLIQMVASSFIFCLTNESHCLLNLLICSVPSDLSHFPLLTETILPLWIDNPLLETMMTDRWLSSCLVDSDGRIFIDRGE